MKKDQDLIVITKTYDLILWSCNHTSKFPRNHRFVLGERIERNLYGLLETLIAAKYTRNRQRLLEDANRRAGLFLSGNRVPYKGGISEGSHWGLRRGLSARHNANTSEQAGIQDRSPSGCVEDEWRPRMEDVARATLKTLSSEGFSMRWVNSYGVRGSQGLQSNSAPSDRPISTET